MKNMIKNMQIKISPTACLSDIIDSYIFRSVISDGETSVDKFMPCRHTSSIDFFIGDEYDTVDLQTKYKLPFSRCTIRGPRTYKKYAISLKGNFKSFSIRFKPTGIYQLLGIPMNTFRDEAIDALLVNPALFNQVTSRLLECNNASSCIQIVEPCFLRMLSSRKPVKITIDRLAVSIADSIDDTQLRYSLTTRQIERNFTKEVGVNPKLYRSLIRFEKMLDQKINQPLKKWTELAYDYNYFDQMHMIKDFHRFLNVNPSQFNPSQFAL
jgi:AraC-like DNA-binding protein